MRRNEKEPDTNDITKQLSLKEKLLAEIDKKTKIHHKVALSEIDISKVIKKEINLIT